MGEKGRRGRRSEKEGRRGGGEEGRRGRGEEGRRGGGEEGRRGGGERKKKMRERRKSKKEGRRGGGEEGRREGGEREKRMRGEGVRRMRKGKGEERGRGGGLKLFTLRHGGYTIEWSYEWLSECSFSCRGRSVGETHSALPHAAASALMSDRLWTPAQLITATQSHLQDPPTKRV